MMRMLIVALICASVTACAIHPIDTSVQMTEARMQVVEQVVDEPVEPSKCPPLPTLPARGDQQLFTLTIIALYQQCAESKK